MYALKSLGLEEEEENEASGHPEVCFCPTQQKNQPLRQVLFQQTLSRTGLDGTSSIIRYPHVPTLLPHIMLRIRDGCLLSMR